MTEHNVGNHYEFLGHLLELIEMVECDFGVLRYKLNCTVHGRCCTIPNGVKIECLGEELDTMNCVKEVDSRYYPTGIPEIDWQRGDIAEIKQGWDRAGDQLEVLAPVVFLEQWWVPVDDPEDGEKGPTYHKEAGLLKVRGDK